MAELGSFFSKKKPGKAGTKKAAEEPKADAAPEDPKPAAADAGEEKAAEPAAAKSPTLTRVASPVPEKRPPSPEPTLPPASKTAWKPRSQRTAEEDKEARKVSPAPDQTRQASPEPEPKKEREPSPPAKSEEEKQPESKVQDKENSGKPSPKKSSGRRGPPSLSFNPNVNPDMDNYRKPSDEDLDKMKSEDPPLKGTWVIWESRAKKGKGTFDVGTEIASVSTVKGFWSYWNHLPQPSQLLSGKKIFREEAGDKTMVESLMVFREGVKPAWEDEKNACGGEFQVTLNPKLGGGQIDEYWNNIVFGMVTGAIQHSDMLMGVRLLDKLTAPKVDRQHIRVEIWYTNQKDKKKVAALRDSVETCLRTKLDGTLSPDWPKLAEKSHMEEGTSAKKH